MSKHYEALFFADTCCPKASSSCFPQTHALHRHSFSQLIFPTQAFPFRTYLFPQARAFRNHLYSESNCLQQAPAFGRHLLSEATCFPQAPAFSKYLLSTNSCFAQAAAVRRNLLSNSRKLLLSAGSSCFPHAPVSVKTRSTQTPLLSKHVFFTQTPATSKPKAPAFCQSLPSDCKSLPSECTSFPQAPAFRTYLLSANTCLPKAPAF